MPRDSLAGLIEPMFRSAGPSQSRAAQTDSQNEHRTIDPNALKIPAPKGRNLH
jgi:hypothetical protein